MSQGREHHHTKHPDEDPWAGENIAILVEFIFIFILFRSIVNIKEKSFFPFLMFELFKIPP